ncbi:alpha-L-arabinofuranosidase [Rhizomicrobium palustre]|uniref:non-reducing end alpha-L-arabinofuranosidase n=1 Tax=Rhizomicrobium palustre TaxID=189966 RepID=A0A846MUD3_9PROT|nr:alpha-L-arabinofuranosidase C-terminal domain-containing protein [Rhizomicrobium palustre]NIK87118.1 alpha-L-arabinofuranosidase [Rhizomicrobium palustre]
MTRTITIHADKPGAAISHEMWGLFFEDINFGADGGLYAELVKNRCFSFPKPMTGWEKISPSKARGECSVMNHEPFSAVHPHFLRLTSQGGDVFGVANEGFRGIGVKAGEAYDLTLRLRCTSGTPALRVALYGENGLLLEQIKLEKLPSAWEERKAVLRPTATDAKSKLYILVDGVGTIDIDLVSLFPQNTWKGRPGGLRADMVQALADIKPGFLRFPGGCIVEGSELDKRYPWKATIAPVLERPLLINRWNYEFLHRPAPDYYQSFGLGFYEYFLLCEDIGAAPLPIINCGMACQFNSGELAPMNEIDRYVQDALDLVEFANGPVETEWGGKRAAMGHPAPFNLTMMGIGNEQWGPQYIERLTVFLKAFRAKYPKIRLIASTGPEPADERFKYLWPKLSALGVDIVDEHCYARPPWFFENAHRFDNYDRKGPKVLFGEYAAQSEKPVSPNNVNDLECALAEAAFMTGLERNADVVAMAAYAPLFAHREAWQWSPDLIWVDNLSLVRTPNYYVQQLFSTNRGDVVLPTKLSDAGDGRVFASAVRETKSGDVIVKIVHPGETVEFTTIALNGASAVLASTIVLSGENLAVHNSFEEPNAVVPRHAAVTASGNSVDVRLEPRSMTVLRIKTA